METRTINEDGSQIHKSSLFMTMNPNLLKKALIPMGDTMIGFQGKKYLVLSNGDNRAIPWPPFVRASRIP